MGMYGSTILASRGVWWPECHVGNFLTMRAVRGLKSRAGRLVCGQPQSGGAVRLACPRGGTKLHPLFQRGRSLSFLLRLTLLPKCHLHLEQVNQELAHACALRAQSSLSIPHSELREGDPPHCTRRKTHQSGPLRKLLRTLRESSLSHPSTSAEAAIVASSRRGSGSSGTIVVLCP